MLAAASLCTTLAACGDSSSPSDTTVENVTTTESEETSNELTDSVPTDLRYDGKTVTFYVRNDLSFAEFNVEEATGDIIDDAVYNRNQTVSERLGVNFEFIEGPGAWGGRKEFA